MFQKSEGVLRLCAKILASIFFRTSFHCKYVTDIRVSKKKSVLCFMGMT